MVKGALLIWASMLQNLHNFSCCKPHVCYLLPTGPLEIKTAFPQSKGSHDSLSCTRKNEDGFPSAVSFLFSFLHYTTTTRLWKIPGRISPAFWDLSDGTGDGVLCQICRRDLIMTFWNTWKTFCHSEHSPWVRIVRSQVLLCCRLLLLSRMHV